MAEMRIEKSLIGRKKIDGTPVPDEEQYDQAVLEGVRFEFNPDSLEIESILVGRWSVVFDGHVWGVFLDGAGVPEADWVGPEDGGLQEALRRLGHAVANTSLDTSAKPCSKTRKTLALLEMLAPTHPQLASGAAGIEIEARRQLGRRVFAREGEERKQTEEHDG